MITKKVDMKNSTKSSFSNLISYITDKQDKLNRVGDISITNCNSNNLEWATLEIESTQKLNTRALSDKTYHLLITFPENETPDQATLKAIEQELCESIGFGEHQRISVVHHDTDHLHVHVAINKIHPTKLTLHEPYNDYYVRNQVSSLLEDKYNLQKDNHNHNHKNTRSQTNSNDMEKMTGIESLITYIKTEIDLSNIKTWDDLHTSLNDKGLEIKPKGNGLIIEDINLGIVVKASSVGYSKSKLEKKLGIFTPNKNFKQSSRTYRKKPIKSKVDTTELFFKYKQNNAALKNKRNDLYKNARLNRDRLIQEAKDRAKLKRTLLKNTKNNPFKKILYRFIYSTLLNDIQKIKASYNKEILAAKNMKPIPWLQWLQNEAKTGNKEVLSVLRSRNSKSNNLDNSIYSEQCAYQEIIPGIKIDNVTKNGNIVYNVANSKIKDTGAAILTSSDSTKNGLAAAILMAKYRYGQNLIVNGNGEFKRKIVNIVVEKNIDINFSDPDLEKYKNELLGDKNEQRAGTKRHRESSPSIRSRANRNTRTRTRTRTNSGQRKFISRIINIGRIAIGTIAGRSHNMRNLSECNLASIERRSKVLLQTNERNNLENNRTGRSDIVRWNVDSGRVKVFGYDIDSAAILAANKYIEERNEKTKKMFDIKKHMQYNELDSGPSSYSYNGLRYINGHALALFETDNNSIAVVPVSKEIESKLRKCSRGTLITINKSGGFNIKQNRRKR